MVLEENIGKLHRLAQENNEELIDYGSFRASLMRSIGKDLDVDQMIIKMIEASENNVIGTYKNGVFVFSDEVIKSAEVLVRKENKKRTGNIYEDESNKKDEIKLDYEDDKKLSQKVKDLLSGKYSREEFVEKYSLLSEEDKRDAYDATQRKVNETMASMDASDPNRILLGYANFRNRSYEMLRRHKETYAEVQKGITSKEDYVADLSQILSGILDMAVVDGKIAPSNLVAIDVAEMFSRYVGSEVTPEELAKLYEELKDNLPELASIMVLSAEENSLRAAVSKGDVSLKELLKQNHNADTEVSDVGPIKLGDVRKLQSDGKLFSKFSPYIPTGYNPNHGVGNFYDVTGVTVETATSMADVNNVIIDIKLGNEAFLWVGDERYRAGELAELLGSATTDMIFSGIGQMYDGNAWNHIKQGVLDPGVERDRQEEMVDIIEASQIIAPGKTKPQKKVSDDPSLFSATRALFEKNATIISEETAKEGDSLYDRSDAFYSFQANVLNDAISSMEDDIPLGNDTGILTAFLQNQAVISDGEIGPVFANSNEELYFSPFEDKDKKITDFITPFTELENELGTVETIDMGDPSETFSAYAEYSFDEGTGYSIPEDAEVFGEMESYFEENPLAVAPAMTVETIVGPEDPVIEEKNNDETVNSVEEKFEYEVFVEDPIVEPVADQTVELSVEQTQSKEETSLAKVTWASKLRRGLKQMMDKAKGLVSKFVNAISGNNSGASSSAGTSGTTSSAAGQGKDTQNVDYLNQHFDINVRAAQEATRAAQEAKAQNPKGQSDKDVEIE